ncbi:MAG: hypothetical protein R6U63_13370 [Longimicrobiales bacterium]
MRRVADRYGRTTTLAALLLLAIAAGACGEDEDLTDVNLLDSELVVGTYDPTTLTFDVAGQTFGEYDLLAGFADDDIPPQLVLANNGTAQLAFLDPETGILVPGNGSYTMLEDGVRITFNSAGDPGTLLLPQTLDLTFDDADGTLTFSSEIQAQLDRLVTLAPELEGEPLSDPVGGLLTAVFTPR